MTFTENGALTYATTGSDCLDLFATVGALRRKSYREIEARFVRAFYENRDIAMKLLFFARDVRGGLGERRVFRVILKWLAYNEPDSLRKNLVHIKEYGRFDDLLTLIDTPLEADALAMIREQLTEDMAADAADGEISLLAKWLPSVNASNHETRKMAKRIARSLGMDDATYRKSLVALRARIRIIENNLRVKDYTFDYSKQPSGAMYKYRKAFIRNDSERYSDFIKKVSAGEARLHADTLAPYELVEPYLNFSWSSSPNLRAMSKEEELALNATWHSLPDFGTSENMLAVIDTSGSMYSGGRPLPAAVALSLGIYLAEHNTGSFANHFIEFSARPRLMELKGRTFTAKLRYLASLCEIANTNLEAVFNLILKAAIKNHVDAGELPTKLVIISDMEFDACVERADLTNIECARERFERAGYKLPDVIFWNVASRRRQQPVTVNDKGVALVSGCTPRLFSMIAGGTIDPYAFMMEVVESERYAPIVA